MKILIATDGSKFSERALHKACELASAPEHACFRIITAYEPQVPVATEPYALPAEYFDRLDKLAREHAEKVAKAGVELIKGHFRNQAVCVSAVVDLGRPAQMIVDAAQTWGADVIVVGSHGHGFWGRLAIGSVSDAVVHHAQCSVLVVKNDSNEAEQ